MVVKVQMRIIELENRVKELERRPKRTRPFKWEEEKAVIYGEINGLRWILNHCMSESEPNTIEQ